MPMPLRWFSFLISVRAPGIFGRNWLVITSALLPKAESVGAECEDAIAINRPLGRFAVADGATEGFDSRRWARYLVKGWTSRTSAGLSDSLLPDGVALLGAELRKRWSGR